MAEKRARITRGEVEALIAERIAEYHEEMRHFYLPGPFADLVKAGVYKPTLWWRVKFWWSDFRKAVKWERGR